MVLYNESVLSRSALAALVVLAGLLLGGAPTAPAAAAVEPQTVEWVRVPSGTTGPTVQVEVRTTGVEPGFARCHLDGEPSRCGPVIGPLSPGTHTMTAQAYTSGATVGPVITSTWTVKTRDTVAVIGTDHAVWSLGADRRFRSLGGYALSAPSVAELDGTTYYVVQGRDDNAWMRTGTTGWRRLSAALPCPAPTLVATVNNPGLQIACVNSDRRLLIGLVNGPPFIGQAYLIPLGPREVPTPPVLLANGYGVFVNATGRVSTINGDRPETLPMTCSGPLGGGGTLGLLNGDISAAWIGCKQPSGSLAVASGSGMTWALPAVNAGGLLVGRPAMAVRPGGRANAYVVGADGAVWSRALPLGAGGWSRIGGKALYGVGAAVTSSS